MIRLVMHFQEGRSLPSVPIDIPSKQDIAPTIISALRDGALSRLSPEAFVAYLHKIEGGEESVIQALYDYNESAPLKDAGICSRLCASM